MLFNSGKLCKIALVVTVCCLLLCCQPGEANPLPGKGKTLSSTKTASSNSKKANAPRHSLGTGARVGLVGTGVAGGILTSLI
ncbi:uncharacterized protein LOC128713570 [Anopheles marshallii]|uniref:uncharacterized protein LOC128713570 n=1 Tax=Anopheles marshallii TaxID=1521116 RepID=UPI00237BEE75|nr:uncharacterized protein LOC128713570 [Anopheles marshallii]